MRIGAQRRERRAVPEHARGRDAVQVERHHERHLFVDHRPRPLEDRSFRVELVLGLHGAMQREVDGISRGGLRLQCLEKLAREPRKAVGGERSGTAGDSAIDRHDLDVAALLEDAERAAEIGAGATPRRQERRAAMHLKIGVAARHRIERGDLLLAFDDQNPMHAGPLSMLSVHRAGGASRQADRACLYSRPQRP